MGCILGGGDPDTNSLFGWLFLVFVFFFSGCFRKILKVSKLIFVDFLYFKAKLFFAARLLFPEPLGDTPMAFLVARGALEAHGFLGWLPKDLVHSISLLQSSFPGEPGLNPNTGSAVLPLLGMASELGCKAEVGRDGGSPTPLPQYPTSLQLPPSLAAPPNTPPPLIYPYLPPLHQATCFVVNAV